MCLTTPQKIVKINVSSNTADLSNGREVNIAAIADLSLGDYVLANANLAVSKISEKEAMEINEYFNNK